MVFEAGWGFVRKTEKRGEQIIMKAQSPRVRVREMMMMMMMIMMMVMMIMNRS